MDVFHQKIAYSHPWIIFLSILHGFYIQFKTFQESDPNFCVAMLGSDSPKSYNILQP